MSSYERFLHRERRVAVCTERERERDIAVLDVITAGIRRRADDSQKVRAGDPRRARQQVCERAST